MEEIMKTKLAMVCTVLLVFGGLVTVEASSANTLVISEVFYDRDGADGNYEWIELFNGSPELIDLSEWSIGWGGDNYANGTLQLGGTITPAEYLVFGGPISDSSNGNPIYSLAVDLSPDLQNSGTTADGIGLFNTPASSITNTSVPFFAVIYGVTNTNNLVGHTGSVGMVDVGDAPAGQSIEFFGDVAGWSINPSPSPGSGPLSTIPIPSAMWLLGSGLLGLVGIRRKKV
jgi:hypothetical protein